MRDSEPTYDVSLHKLVQVACLNLCIRLNFYLFCKIIYSNEKELSLPLAAA